MKRDCVWKLWSLEERRNRQDLIEVFKICKGFTRIRPDDLFYFDVNGKGTRGDYLKLVKVRCTRESRKYFFSNKLINMLNHGPRGSRCDQHRCI